MDLLGENSIIKQQERDFRIYSRNTARPPQFIGKGAVIKNSMISEGTTVNGKVVNSVLAGGVVIEEGAEVYNSVIMSDVVIKKGASVHYAIVDRDATIGEGVFVGHAKGSSESITVVSGEEILQNEGKKVLT